MNPDTHQQMLARVAMLIRGTELAEFDISRDQKLRLALQHSRGRRPAPVA